MHDPREPHNNMLKRILRYLKGTINQGLQLHRTSPSTLTSYTDADWAGCPETRRSTSGYAVFLGDNLVSWSSKRQTTSPAPVPRPSIAPWQTSLPSHVGCVNFFPSFIDLSVRQLSSSATTSVQFTSPPTLCSISGQNMSKLTCISSGSVLHLEKLEFSMSPPACSMRTSSRKVCRHQSSTSSAPA